MVTSPPQAETTGRVADTTRYDAHAWAGKPRHGQAYRQEPLRFPSGFVRLRKKRGQSGLESPRLGSFRQRPGDGYVLGRPMRTIVDSDGYAWMVGTHKAEPKRRK